MTFPFYLARTEIASLDILLLIMLVVTAIISLQVKDLLAASMIFGVYSFLMCLLWASMSAVDVFRPSIILEMEPLRL